MLPHEVKEGKLIRTPINCIALCKMHGFLLAGVQYSDNCWCGNTPPPSTARTSESECNMPCSGDSSKTCGGSWRMNVYSAGKTKALFFTKTSIKKDKFDNAFCKTQCLFNYKNISPSVLRKYSHKYVLKFIMNKFAENIFF